MKIISFMNSKGGVGKTTLATNVAHYLSMQNARVLLVDSDPQGSARDWQEAGEQNFFDIIAADKKATLNSLPSVLENNPYDYVIIDTAGQISETVAAAISISDICLVPICPSPYDIWASEDLVDMILIRQQLTSGRPDANFVITQCNPNTNISKEVWEIINLEGKLNVIGAPIYRRSCFVDSAKLGMTVFHTGTRLAKHEISTLGKAIILKDEEGEKFL